MLDLWAVVTFDDNLYATEVTLVLGEETARDEAERQLAEDCKCDGHKLFRHSMRGTSGYWKVTYITQAANDSMIGRPQR
jgi:hypothetical protein